MYKEERVVLAAFMMWPYTSVIIIRVVRFYFVGTILHSGWFLKTFLRRLRSKKKKTLVVAVRRPILSTLSHCRNTMVTLCLQDILLQCDREPTHCFAL